ncbi:MAG: hypothetical protein KAJ63_06140, partial [Methyloprofundus sp.]|nr:hypothetical protein [Methyloprofundus sp.]
MPRYTLNCVGFEQAQQASIAAILDLADSALSHSWNIIESTESDVVLINMQEETGQQLISEYSSLPEYRIILVADSSQESFQNYWFLEKKEHAPPSLRVLVDLLNQLGICLDEAEAKQASELRQESVEVHLAGKVEELQEPVEPVELEEQEEQEE